MTAGETTVGVTTVIGGMIVTGGVIVIGGMAAIGAGPNGAMNAAIGGRGAGKSVASGANMIATCPGSIAAEDSRSQPPAVSGSMRDGFVDSRLDPVAVAGLSRTGR
ncbi:hypothetical protein NXC12_CH01713 [Rhizobium etli]|uniref:Uncharacterized protein n=1 Tax=Rhizobium etli TaxID=29449 RepID=A0AAN1BEB4_RHIET|nr:hypothetical protein NXC12_CH01713 [Rhizobium etli]